MGFNFLTFLLLFDTIYPIVKDEKVHEEIDEGALPRIYEIGYHVVPTVLEEDVPTEINAIRDLVEDIGGMIVMDENPKLIRLAYPMTRAVGHKKNIFDSAYFGWIKFQADPEKISELKSGLENNEKILRFIIIKTVRESTLARKFPVKIKRRSDSDHKLGMKPKGDADTLSEKELDKTIEELVIE